MNQETKYGEYQLHAFERSVLEEGKVKVKCGMVQLYLSILEGGGDNLKDAGQGPNSTFKVIPFNCIAHPFCASFFA